MEFEEPLSVDKKIFSRQTSVRHVKSNMQKVSTGVPHGSILGPLLFLIYINDFPLASTHFNFIMYADDTTLYSTIESPNNDDSK